MNKPKIIIELTGGNIVALHSDNDVDFHIVDWDSKSSGMETWERACKNAVDPDRMIDKKFDYYINEILNA